MCRTYPAHALDLKSLRDEELVVLAQECGYHPAETELILRFRDWTNSLIRQLARRRELSPGDVEDAIQDSVFGVLKAIARYDTQHAGKRQAVPFQAFLHRVVSDRFKDFVKGLWRYKGRFGRSLPQVDSVAGHMADEVGQGWQREAREGDPAMLIERKELLVRFDDFVSQLDATGRGLVDGLVSGLRLRVIATHLRISYDVAKRRRRQIRSQLAERLGDLAGTRQQVGVA